MIGPFRTRSLALIVAVAGAIGGLLLLASIQIPVATQLPPTAAATRFVTDPSATGPLIGSTFEIPADQPLAAGGSWSNVRGRLDGARLVMIDLFATWCPPCQQETPLLRSFDRTYGAQGLRIVGVSVNEIAATVARYGERYGIEYPLLVDADGSLFRSAAAGGLPTKILLDAEGRVLAVLPRPLTVADGTSLIEPLLNAGE